MINILTGASSGGSPGKLFAYLPFAKLTNNRQKGLSKRSDGTTDAEGTLYPTDLNTSSGIGSINSFAAQMANYSAGKGVDDNVYTNNQTKYFVGENYFTKYKRFKTATVTPIL